MGNKIVWAFLILLISFASCEKNKVARQPTPQNSARAAKELEENKRKAIEEETKITEPFVEVESDLRSIEITPQFIRRLFSDPASNNIRILEYYLGKCSGNRENLALIAEILPLDHELRDKVDDAIASLPALPSIFDVCARASSQARRKILRPAIRNNEEEWPPILSKSKTHV
jgi:hypothetical protein